MMEINIGDYSCLSVDKRFYSTSPITTSMKAYSSATS